MKDLLQKYALLPLALLCACYIFIAFGSPAHDFSNYYFGGKFLADGRFGSWIYFPYEFNKAIAAEGYSRLFASYAPNTPFLALFFLPFSYLPLAFAKLAFNILSTILLLFALKRLVAFYRISPIYLILIPIVFFVPIKNELLFGQVYFVLFFLLSETWIAYRKNKKTKAAFFLGLAIMLKIFPVLLALAFLFRKKMTLLAYTACCCGLLFLISVLFSGSAVWLFFIETISPKASEGEISEAYVRNYQSVSMMLKELLVYDSTENPNPLWHQPVVFAALLLAFKIKMIAVGYYISRKVKMPLFTLSFWILCMLLISPYGSTYALLLLIFPFLCASKMEIPQWQKGSAFVLFLLICNIPVTWISTLHFPLAYTRLLLMLVLLALACLLVWKVIDRKVVAIAVLLPTVVLMLLKKPDSDHSKAILSKDEPILIYDYAISNQKLTYFYWNENGENSASIAFGKTVKKGALLHDNEVFYDGRPVTFDHSNKCKAIALNDNTVVFLSDYGRGIGFYNLRVASLKKPK